VLLFDSKDSVIQNLLVWGSFPHSEIQPNILSLKMLHLEKERDADQLFNTFYSFNLALSHLANYSYATICFQFVAGVSQESTQSTVSAGLVTVIFRPGLEFIDSGFILTPLPAHSTECLMSKLCHIAEPEVYIS